MNVWQVESLRLTMFKSNPSEQVLSSWESLIGEKPTNVDSKPREDSIREEGPCYLGTLVYNSNPVRIDWVLGPSQEQMQEAFPLIGSFDDSSKQFIDLISKWFDLPNLPAIKRLALGASLRLPADNKQSAYEKLATFLPSVKLDVSNSSDFLYQINRPTQSRTITGLQINRLSRWNVSRRIGVGLVFDSKPAVVTDTAKEALACCLELDINTAQDYNQIFPKGVLLNILLELKGLAEKIATDGDV